MWNSPTGCNGKHLSLQFDGDRAGRLQQRGLDQHVGVMRGLVEGQVTAGRVEDRLMHDPTLLMEAYLACAHRPAGLPLKR
jgi:hypothetical protein